MVKFEVDVTINRSAGDVFAYLGDPRKEPEYSGVTQQTHLEGSEPIGVGTRYKQVAKFMGEPAG